jgi:glycosyltransferase involved in cell wall biosynthesis
MNGARSRSLSISMLAERSVVLDEASGGGAERQLLAETALLRRRGHQVRVYVSDRRGDLPGVRRIRYPGGRGRGWFLYHALFAAAAGRADILHAATDLALASLLRPERCLTHFPRDGGVLPGYSTRSWTKSRYRRSWFAFQSEAALGHFAEAYPAIPAERCFAIPGGVDLSLFRPREAREPREPRRPVRLAFAGQWAEVKGITDLLDAIVLLEAKRDDFELVVFGSAGLWNRVSAAGRSSELWEKEVLTRIEGMRSVRIGGQQTQRGMAEAYRDIDVAVVPSRSEAMGLSTIEAQAAGLPVVGTRVGGIPEVVVDGQTGLLVPPRDPPALSGAIEKLLDRPDLRRSMGARARERAERRFGWERHVDLLTEVYERMASDRVGRVLAEQRHG